MPSHRIYVVLQNSCRKVGSRLSQHYPVASGTGCRRPSLTYRNVYRQLTRYLPDGRKKSASESQVPRSPVLARQAVFLFLHRSEKLEAEEEEMLALLRSLHTEVDQAYELVQQFTQMLRERSGKLLDGWLDQVKQSHILELQSFVAGVEKDKEAVKAGLIWWIKNGVVEGHATKLKLITRQGYGQHYQRSAG